MKIRAMGAELFHANRQTDEAHSRFLQVCESASKGYRKLSNV